MTIWGLDPDERAACFALTWHLHSILESRFSPGGFNVGAKCA